MNENSTRKSLLVYGMEGGLWLGLYLILRFFMGVAGMYSPILNALAMILFIGTPVVLYYIMAKYHKQNGYVSGFSLLWMMGIMLFFFASLICCVPEYIFYQYISPDYISQTMSRSIELIEEMGLLQGNDASNTALRQALDEAITPTSLQMIMSSMWSNVFFGSLLSIVVAPFVTKLNKK